MKVLSSILLVFFVALLLFSVNSVFADVAPPKNPPGGGISPYYTTYVQMVAENVLLDITESSAQDKIINVSAEFIMLNHGSEDEAMKVRFPLENLEGYGDGYGNFPQITDFSVWIEGLNTSYTIIEEPVYEDGTEPVSWATFDVVFPAGKEVLIQVDYISELYGFLDEQALASYIFETGAGWYGPIKSAHLVLRLPYTANPSNVFTDTIHGYDERAEFSGNEVHWKWTDFNPTHYDNFYVQIVWPHQWLHILELESEVNQNPQDVEAVIALAQAYRESDGINHSYYIRNEYLAESCENTVLEALLLLPYSPDLHVEMARIYLWRARLSWDIHYNEIPDNPAFEQAIAELTYAMQLDSENEHLLKLLEDLESPFGSLITAYLTETSNPDDVPPDSKISAENLTTANVSEDSNDNTDNILYVLLFITGVIVFILALLRIRSRGKSK